MDTTQLIIITVSIALTALLIVLGIQVFYILKEIRFSIKKVNKMLEDMGKVTGTVGDSVQNIGGFVSGLKSGLAMVGTLKHKKGDDDE